jgi:acetyl esterase/lipase
MAGRLPGEALAPKKRPEATAAVSGTFKVEVRENVTYFDGLPADRAKHQLDIYIPQGKRHFPVLFFVHGGAWTIGDKKGDLGVFQVLGRSLAGQGLVVVASNYRLSPRVRHPAHIQDVGRAFAWTVKHIKEYGGRTDALFIAGHSAGGQLVALLATDPSFLKAEGLTVEAIRGVVPISGVFEIPDKGIFDGPFGTDPAVRKQASPLFHVRPGLPPFLVVCADRDLPTCGKQAADAFAAALRAKDDQVKVLEIQGRNHVSIVFSMLADKDPARTAILSFIRKHTPPEKKP